MNSTLRAMAALCYEEVERLLSSAMILMINKCPKQNATPAQLLKPHRSALMAAISLGSKRGPKRIEFTIIRANEDPTWSPEQIRDLLSYGWRSTYPIVYEGITLHI